MLLLLILEVRYHWLRGFVKLGSLYLTEYGLKANEYPIKQTFTHKANDIPTKQTYTFTAVCCDRRKQEKPVQEMTPGRVAL